MGEVPGVGAWPGARLTSLGRGSPGTDAETRMASTPPPGRVPLLFINNASSGKAPTTLGGSAVRGDARVCSPLSASTPRHSGLQVWPPGVPFSRCAHLQARLPPGAPGPELATTNSCGGAHPERPVLDTPLPRGASPHQPALLTDRCPPWLCLPSLHCPQPGPEPARQARAG